MASNQTPIYGLNQWSLDDGIIMAEFNADNQKTEQALVDTNENLSTLRQATEILQADHSALVQSLSAARTEAQNGDNALLQVLNAAKATIPNIVVGSYAGTGTWGADNPCSLTFDFEPKLVIIALEPDAAGYKISSSIGLKHQNSTGPLIAVRGATTALLDHDNNSYGGNFQVIPLHLNWSGTTFSWYLDRGDCLVEFPHLQMNHAGMTYRYFAIG